MPARPSARTTRDAALALLVGAIHAAAIAWFVARLDYPVNALENAPGGVPGAAVGLVAVLAVPAYLALRHRLVGPALAAVAGVAWPVYRELATAAPEFSERGGYTVVSGARYVDAYVDAWYVWLLASLLVGLAEYVVRVDRAWLPSPAARGRLDEWLRRDRRPALRTAAVVAVAHAAVFLALAADWSYFDPNGFLPSPWYVGLAVLAWTLLGLALLGGVPAYLLVRTRLVAPTPALAWLVHRTGFSQNMPLPDDPLPIYFLGWFFFLGLLLAVAGVEYGLRRLGRWGRSRLAAN